MRKIGGATIRSIGHVARLQRLSDNDADYVDPHGMLPELSENKRTILASMREAHELCGEEKRRRHHEPIGDLDRRNGTTRLVPLLNHAYENSVACPFQPFARLNGNQRVRYQRAAQPKAASETVAEMSAAENFILTGVNQGG